MAKTDGTGLSKLDIAHQLRMDGKRDEALRIGVAGLNGSPQQIGTALLLSQILVDAGRPEVAIEALTRIMDAFVRRGSLPEAVVAAWHLKRAGQSPDPYYGGIAAAFAKGSKRVADVPQAPPPLPSMLPPPAGLNAISGDALLSRAEQALVTFMSAADDTPPNLNVPSFPLFGALDAKSLSKLLQTLIVVDVKQSAVVMKQGEEGRDAIVVTRGALSVVRKNDAGVETKLAVLGPGAIVGEMALVTDAPRAATVRADEPTIVLVVQRDTLEKIAAENPQVAVELGNFCRGRMLSNLLRHSPILSALQLDQRESLITRFETQSFGPGDVLVSEEEDSPGLFLIASGGVKVMSADKDGDRIQLARLGPGDVVGEISLVLRRPATATVVAEHETVTLTLQREKFQEVIREHPVLLNELYELATKREEETRSVIGQASVDASDFVIV
jgi:CRP-like cAMP-binding protein